MLRITKKINLGRGKPQGNNISVGAGAARQKAKRIARIFGEMSKDEAAYRTGRQMVTYTHKSQ